MQDATLVAFELVAVLAAFDKNRSSAPFSGSPGTGRDPNTAAAGRHVHTTKVGA